MNPFSASVGVGIKSLYKYFINFLLETFFYHFLGSYRKRNFVVHKYHSDELVNEHDLLSLSDPDLCVFLELVTALELDLEPESELSSYLVLVLVLFLLGLLDLDLIVVVFGLLRSQRPSSCLGGHFIIFFVWLEPSSASTSITGFKCWTSGSLTNSCSSSC